MIEFEAISLGNVGFDSATFALVPTLAEVYGIAEQQFFDVSPHVVGILLPLRPFGWRKRSFKGVDGFVAEVAYLLGDGQGNPRLSHDVFAADGQTDVDFHSPFSLSVSSGEKRKVYLLVVPSSNTLHSNFGAEQPCST